MLNVLIDAIRDWVIGLISSRLTINSISDISSIPFLRAGQTIFVKDSDITFTIVVSSTETVDGIFVIDLNNGLYALMNYTEETILPVRVADINTGDRVGVKLRILISKVKGKIKGLSFEDGTYYIEHPVKLESLEYIGKGSDRTIFEVVQDFDAPPHELDLVQSGEGYGTYYDRVFFTSMDGGSVKPSTWSEFSITFKGIKILYKSSTDSTLATHATILLHLRNINGFLMENCVLEATPDTVNPAWNRTTLMWFRKCLTLDNIVIRNCDFINREGLSCTPQQMTQFCPGGALWLDVWDDDITTANHITIDNCNFITAGSDEVLGMWGGTFNDILVNNCNFEVLANGHTNNNMIAFNGALFNNCIVQNCNFNLKNISCVMMKIGEKIKSSSTFLWKNLNVYADYDTVSSYKPADANSVGIFIYTNSNNVDETSDKVYLTIDSCKVRLKENSYYPSVCSFASHNLDATVKNCDFDVSLTTIEQGRHTIIGTSAQKSKLTITGNTIKHNANSILNIQRNATECSVECTANVIEGLYTAMMNCSNSRFSFVDNYISEPTAAKTLITTQLEQPPSPKNTIIVGDNNIENKPKYFFDVNLFLERTNIPTVNDFATVVKISDVLIKTATMPFAWSRLEGVQLMYIGNTNNTYTKGQTYECKAVAGSDPVAYKWYPLAEETPIDFTTWEVN